MFKVRLRAEGLSTEMYCTRIPNNEESSINYTTRIEKLLYFDSSTRELHTFKSFKSIGQPECSGKRGACARLATLTTRGSGALAARANSEVRFRCGSSRFVRRKCPKWFVAIVSSRPSTDSARVSGPVDGELSL